MAGVRHLAVVDGHHEIPICLCSDAADQVVHGGDTVRGQETDSSNGLQVSDDLFKSAIQFSNGLVNVGFYRQEFGGFRVRAAALKLRQRNCAFSFTCSHFASYKAIWSGRVRC